MLGIYAYHPFGEEASQAQQADLRLRFTGHERDGRGTGFADDLDYMHARYYSPGVGRFLSVDPAADSAHPSRPQSWNRYAYVEGNPLKYIDPTGEVISLASLSSGEQTELLAELGDFTGNEYGVDESGNLTLVEAGADSSATATEFLNDLMGTAEVFNVVSTNSSNQFNLETGNIEINFSSFEGADYGKVDSRAFNLGSTLIHELHHAATGLFDTLDGSRTGSFRMSYDWISPTVGFVNQVRSERSLPQRAAYAGEPVGFLKHKDRFRFSNVNPRKPERIYYVVRKRH